MEQQYMPKYGLTNPSEVMKFSYFVEYVKDNKLKELMSNNNLKTADFCEWVSNSDKVPTAQEVREIKSFFMDEDSKRDFLSDGFQKARETLILKKPGLISKMYKNMEAITQELKDLNAYDIDQIANNNKEAENIIEDLATWSRKTLNNIKASKNG